MTPTTSAPVVIAVIPTFRPPDALRDHVSDLLTQVHSVVLVDDGTASTNGLGIDDQRVEVIELPENGGIARALNVGITAARASGATHVLTLDQDSWIPEGYVERSLAVLSEALRRGEEPVGAVPSSAGGTGVVLDRDGRPFDPIQAGQVVRLEVFDRVGPFEEALFIDAVDSEYTLRAWQGGFRYVLVPGTDIGHELGTLVPLTIFGRQLVLGGRPRHLLYHAPFRTYYMVRNSVILSRRYGRERRSWTWRRTRLLSSMIFGGLLIPGDRAAQLLALRRGIRDGRAGITGRIPDELMSSLARLGRKL
ncbi:rhamnosyltransferase [Microbacterium natoriense]|uniref:Rhamnosyltransferase n=1 Tax=Microbacterium natoriense TaxID=284570 RepID=A0AAW8EWX2_9MICO|nr:glycosyltransferase [Microbacterium natoriense]MDQ0647753.1 rhamnosyltransferase [Microbacterium natoriense]